MVNNNLPVTGMHTGVMVEQPGKDSVLFDPAGDYRKNDPYNPRPWGGDAFYGKDADLGSYVDHQRRTDGPDVNVYHFPVSADDADKIRSNIDGKGAIDPGWCAVNVGDVLRGIGPFQGLGNTTTPSMMDGEMRRLQPPQQPQSPDDPILSPSSDNPDPSWYP